MQAVLCWVNSPDLVCKLGVFEAPANAFVGASNDFAMVSELLQSEHGFMEDLEHEKLFIGAGPIGGKFKMTVFDWNETTQPNLTNNDIIAAFTDNDLGGYVDVATAVFFEENGGDGGSSGGCNSGMIGIIALGLAGLIAHRKK